MRKILDDLVRIEGVLGCLLVSQDGLVVASTLPDDEDAEVLGAMTAAMFASLARSAEKIGVGTLRNTIIESEYGAIQLFDADDLVLVVISEPWANLGLVRVEMRRSARQVRASMAKSITGGA